MAQSHAACDVLGLERGFDENDLYENLSWPAERQAEIEQRLFRMRLGARRPQLFLYGVTSSYPEGTGNALSAYGCNRGKKRGKKQIVIGLLCGEARARGRGDAARRGHGDMGARGRGDAARRGCLNTLPDPCIPEIPSRKKVVSSCPKRAAQGGAPRLGSRENGFIKGGVGPDTRPPGAFNSRAIFSTNSFSEDGLQDRAR